MNSLISYGSSPPLADNFGFASFFNHLLKTKNCVDVTFILETDDGEIKLFAHQLVLAMRSSYFADMFSGDKKEKGMKIIRYGKINPKAFEDMIRYCYDCKPELETLEDICVLFGVAHEFRVKSLVNLCLMRLMDIEITPRNILRMVEVSECIKDEKFKDMCYNFLQENTKDVMESNNMAQVTPAMVRIILDLPKLALDSENELIKWLFDWANAKVEEKDSVYRNARECLQDFLQYMNFLALTSEEFAKLCEYYPGFFTSEEIASICLNIALPGTREMPDWYSKELKIREYVGLREKLINKDVVEAKKYALDISPLEVILNSSYENSFRFLTKSMKFETDLEDDMFEKSLAFYILLKHFDICYKICYQLLKMTGKCDELKRLKLGGEDRYRKVIKCLSAMISAVEHGGLKYLSESEMELKEAFNIDDEDLDHIKGCIADKAQACQEILENDKAHQRMKIFLVNVEELEVFKILENLDLLYKSYNEREGLNEFSKGTNSLVIERAKKLTEDYLEFVTFITEVLNNMFNNM